jgi:hypothetical protein
VVVNLTPVFRRVDSTRSFSGRGSHAVPVGGKLLGAFSAAIPVRRAINGIRERPAFTTRQREIFPLDHVINGRAAADDERTQTENKNDGHFLTPPRRVADTRGPSTQTACPTKKRVFLRKTRHPSAAACKFGSHRASTLFFAEYHWQVTAKLAEPSKNAYLRKKEGCFPNRGKSSLLNSSFDSNVYFGLRVL